MSNIRSTTIQDQVGTSAYYTHCYDPAKVLVLGAAGATTSVDHIIQCIVRGRLGHPNHVLCAGAAMS